MTISRTQTSKRPARGLRARILAAALGSVVAVFVVPAIASATIHIYEASPEASELGVIEKGKCSVKKTGGSTVFHAGAKTTNGVYTLGVDILAFSGYGAAHNVEFGSANPTVNVESVNGDDFSNNYPFPGGMPPRSAGKIEFTPNGSRLGIAMYGLPSADYKEGVVIAGAMKCASRKRR